MAVIATSLFWGAFLEFRPPAEESGVTFDEAIESARSVHELAEWYFGRLEITAAIKRQLDELEARRARSPDNAALDDEMQRLRQNLLAEHETTRRLWTAKQGELNQDHARAVSEWQRSRRVLLAMALAAAVLAGWLFWQARLRYREQVFVERAAGADRRRSAKRRAEAGDPQWNQKLAFYAVFAAIAVAMVLYGLSDREQTGGKHREDYVVFGLVSLAMSTIWLFFGSIDWSDWNAIKDRVTSRTSPADDDQPPDSAADG